MMQWNVIDNHRDYRLRQWHTAYAWLPRQMESGVWVWLEIYYRKLEFKSLFIGYEYRKVTKEEYEECKDDP